MKKKDNITILINYFLIALKRCCYMKTVDDKYSIYLQKVTESTAGGKAYHIVISDLTADWFIDKGEDK